jgi:hypothetical protein
MEGSMSRLDRQSFLGSDNDLVLRNATIGFAGLGGGGSHLVQQFAHLGLGGYVMADDDIIEDTNTNRLVGGTLADVAAARSKLDIAVRTVRALIPDARIVPVLGKWQDAIEALKDCDIIIGALDSYVQRDQLERFCRRHLIPYVDIGMDVHPQDTGGHFIGGQVILSSPGGPCLHCCGFITDEKLKREAEKYGSAGSRPQVVWPNGVLASTAVGLAVQLLAPWHRTPLSFAYLTYDGNRGAVTPSLYMRYAAGTCPHHPLAEAGDPLFDLRRAPSPAGKPVAAAPDKAWGRLRRWWEGLFGHS